MHSQIVAVAAALVAATVHAAGPQKYWDIEPYRIHLTIAIDAPAGLADQLAAELPIYFKQRVAASIGALWRLETEVATGGERHRLLKGLDALSDGEPIAAVAGEEKQLFATLRWTPWGYELSAREYDRYVQRWGATVHAAARQRDALAEQMFALVHQAVAPLAQVTLDTDNSDLVQLTLRGSALPQRSDDVITVEPGDAFLPVLRRTTREGELVTDGVQVVPWTYIEVTGLPDAEGGSKQIVGRVQSGTRRPLGVRRRGRIEQVAIALRADPADATIRLHSRTEAEKPLVAYDVFAQNTGEKETRLVGLSDENGELCVAPGKTAIQLLYVKSAGELLARLPIVPGVDRYVDVPLPDDDVRLRAQARLAALREDLVDLVARRNIFMARVRHQIEEKNYGQARELLELLDELPGRAQFNQQLEREARLHRASDPQVQRRIEQLFTATQTVLGQFLDPRPISELHDELRAAQQRQQGADAPSEQSAARPIWSGGTKGRKT